jgi:hypothetical protein
MSLGEQLSVLFITRRFHNRVNKSTEYLISELQKQSNLSIWENDGDLCDIVSKLPNLPSFVLLNDFKPDYTPKIRGLRNTSIPVGAILHEIKYKPYRRKLFYERENIKHIFTHYRDASNRIIPDLRERYIWLPHYVPLDVFKDYGQERDIDCLMMGILMERVYPKRFAMYKRLLNYPGFIYHDHPGYGELPTDSYNLIGINYAKELSRAKIFVTCDSIEKLPIMKYFECLACKTLLMGTGSEELKELGFIDGETYVEVDEHNVLEKVTYYLERDEERKQIVENGYNLVAERHSVEKRVQELLCIVTDIISNRRDV